MSIIKVLHVTVGDEALNQAVKIRNDATRHLLINVREDAVETLRQLKHMGMKLGLISDSTPEVSIIWQETDVAHYFDSVIFSHEVKIKKPNTAIYLKMCQRLNCAPDQCIYVGDGGSHELSGAENVGMFPLLLSPTTDDELFLPSRDNWKKEKIATLTGVLSYISR